ncbi:pimeloyl-CoA dehydrogenase small subunit [Sphingobium sp. SCG-1]|uniref:acyl-CoA dehydrogenase family protein n=1 Tax=Sphingobium sp. SCG-1 TaxID=2072936 RepID=UPI000CD6BA30|nr:acyl-CoA dehydrogenase [Sphingobium sp. SCG-1]AUW56984.1 pimeloyl-CoA dehydrogenase small subunit [Sphingobium sp. SCG-1]
MDFNHSEDRQMLADTLARYLQQRYPTGVRHKISSSDTGWSSEHWSALAELGVVGALFPEEAGGFGGSGFDIAAVFEQFGKALVVEPFLGTLLAGRILSKVQGQKQLLEEVIAGTVPLAFAHEEPQSRYDLAQVAVRAEQNGGVWTLSGCKAVVPQLEAANQILVSARIAGTPGEESGIGLFLTDVASSGSQVRGYPLVDGGRGGELILAGSRATLIAENGYSLIEDAVATGLVALSWEAIGVMDVLKAATLDYLRTRKQFGVPIGKFQALQHRMANMSLEIEQARSAGINAAAALDETRVARERAVSAAKFTIGRVGTLVAEEAIQLHGGIGMTWELPLSHYAKRLTMIGHQLGDEDHHLDRFVALGRVA